MPQRWQTINYGRFYRPVYYDVWSLCVRGMNLWVSIVTTTGLYTKSCESGDTVYKVLGLCMQL